ncbi:hypothetical protein [Candidatus Methylopumilus planktonicus]|uniref:hypothetical protein n=1 Tax=Candidatus Methylopumilus planktonicus TaxID=1581557 RepID=UPI003BEEBF18
MNTQAVKVDSKKLKILFLLYLLPTICEYFFKYSSPLTSPGYSFAHPWFSWLKTVVQCLLLVFFLYPFRAKITIRNILIWFSLIAYFLVLILYKYSNDLIDPNTVAIKSFFIFIGFVAVLTTLKTEYILLESTIKFIFNIFFVGFVIQIFVYYFFGINPSHSPDFFLFPRFNAVTNDSLATGLIIPLFIPLLINKKTRIFHMLILILMSISTGSFSSLFITLFLLFSYLAYKKLFSLIVFNVFALAVSGVIFYEEITYILSYKIDSILVHLDYFIKLFSSDQTNCKEIFCESFFAWSISISWITTLLFYISLGYMIKKLIDFAQAQTHEVVAHSVLCLGFSILISSLFHPVIIIPFAINLFFIAFFILSNAHVNSLSKLKVKK